MLTHLWVIAVQHSHMEWLSDRQYVVILYLEIQNRKDFPPGASWKIKVKKNKQTNQVHIYMMCERANRIVRDIHVIMCHYCVYVLRVRVRACAYA